MQFHLNGFKPGDPRIERPDLRRTPGLDDTLPEHVDVLIVGCGPAGLTLAAQLAAFPDITTCIVDQKPGPLVLGQADGIACRTVEMFEAFGFSERALREAYWVNETSFWKPDEERRENIVRSGRIQDTEDGLSEFPHLILNQARVHDFLLDRMRNGPAHIEPAYGRGFLDLSVGEQGPDEAGDHPVTVLLERRGGPRAGAVETVRARYVVGCDGARSGVRHAMGLTLQGDSANQAWGVMDVLAVTDFPDIRLKAAIHSASEGSLLVIPREGGYLVRLYIELDKLNPDERVADRNITVDHLIAAATRILHPYSLDVKEVAWWSVYEIGQRLCDRFDDVPEEQAGTRTPRVFIAGDACHTHSPKAGQGMNVSMQDAFNLGWKLASVVRKQSSPNLLQTYSAERRAIAQELIEFDRAFARMFSAAPKRSGDADRDGVDPAEFQRYFLQQGRFTAGTATRYGPSAITSTSSSQHLAPGFVIGMRLHSAPVIRVADAKPVELAHCVKADGRWRLFIFADEADAPFPRVRSLCAFLSASPASPLRRYTPAGADPDALIDVRAVFPRGHRDLSIAQMPDLLLPRKGRYGLVDYEKIFAVDAVRGDILAMRGIERSSGCIVAVRPDQYVAGIFALDAHVELGAFFAGVMTGPEQMRSG